MKFSEMTTRQQAKIVCGIAASVSRIAKDDEVYHLMESFASDDDQEKTDRGSGLGFIVQMTETVIPLLLDRHYDDTMAIAAALTDKPVSELETMGIFGIVREVRGVLDGELIGFFKQSGSSEAGK